MCNKITILILAFIGLSAHANAQDTTEFHPCFFTPKSYLVGTALSLDLHQFSPLLNLRAYYNLEKHICVGLEYSNNFSREENEQEINAVGHYIFDVFGIGVYPLVGFGILRNSKELHSEKNNHIGGKVGLGLHRNYKHLTFFMEYSHGRYNNNFAKNIASVGILYEIKSR